MSASVNQILTAYRLLDGDERRQLAEAFPRLSAAVIQAAAAEDEENFRESLRLRREILARKVSALKAEGSHVPTWMLDEARLVKVR